MSLATTHQKAQPSVKKSALPADDDPSTDQDLRHSISEIEQARRGVVTPGASQRDLDPLITPPTHEFRHQPHETYPDLHCINGLLRPSGFRHPTVVLNPWDFSPPGGSSRPGAHTEN